MKKENGTDFFEGFNNSDYQPLLNRRNRTIPLNPLVDSQWRKNGKENYDDKHSEPGNVYIIIGLLSRFKVKAKIGLSRSPKRRLRELRDDYGAYLFPVFIITTNNMNRLEKSVHHKFKSYRSPELFGTGRTEWFEINPIRLVKIITFMFFKEKFFRYSDILKSMKDRLK